MRNLFLLFITLICAASACQKQSRSDKTFPIMKTNTKNNSPLADTFKLADDLLIPYRTKDSLFGYVNKAGEMIIEPQWTMAFPFSGNRSVVVNKTSDAVAMIDREGNYITEFTYLQMAPSGHPGHWQARLLGGQWGVIDTLGNELIPIGFESMFYVKELGWYKVKLDGKLGYIDASGKIMLPFEYDEIKYSNAEEGFPHFWCKKNNEYTYLDKDLNEFLKHSFDYAYPFIHGRAQVIDEGRFLVINLKGDITLDFSNYSSLNYSNKNVGIVTDKNENIYQIKYGLLNYETGKLIKQMKFSRISTFNDGYAIAKIKDKETNKELVGIINEKGEWTVEPKYEYISYNENGQYMAQYPNEKMSCRLIKPNGDLIFESNYYISPMITHYLNSTNFLRLKNYDTDPTTMGIFDLYGNEILAIQYTDLPDEGFGDDGLIQVKKDGIRYFMDIKGNEYIQR